MKNHNSMILLIILLMAFLSRAYFLFQDSIISTDGVRYALSGKNLIENGAFETFGKPEIIFPPGYPILIGIADHFFYDLTFSAKFISFLSGLLLVFLLYAIGKKMFGEKAGLFSAFFSALHIKMITLSFSTMSESLYLFFILLSLYLFLILLEKNRIWLSVLLGSVIGYSYLIRPEGIIFMMLPAFLFIFRKKEIGIKKTMLLFLSAMISFSFVIAPYVWFLYRNTGELTFTKKTNSNIMAGEIFGGEDINDAEIEKIALYEKVAGYYNEKNNKIEIPEKYDDLNLKNIFLRDPELFVKRYTDAFKSEIKILILKLQLDIILFPLIISFLYAWRDKIFRNSILLLSTFPLIFLSVLPLFHIEGRYLTQVLVFLILLSAPIFSTKSNFILLRFKGMSFSSGEFLNVFKAIVLFVIFVQFASMMAYLNNSDTKNYPIEHRIAGNFLAGQADFDHETDIIMSRKPFAAFYSDSMIGSPNIPYTTPENILKFAKANKVNYIVIDERFLSIRENYSELARLDDYSGDVQLVFEDDSIRPIKIFRTKF